MISIKLTAATNNTLSQNMMKVKRAKKPDMRVLQPI